MPKKVDTYITLFMKGVGKMTSKEKLQFFVDNGMSLSYIANRMEVDITTLSKWLHNQKGISTKNEEKMIFTLQNIVEDFKHSLE